MKGELKLFLAVLTLINSFVALPTFGESFDFYHNPMCERFYLSGSEGNTSINYEFEFRHDVLFNVTIINDQNSTLNLTIEKIGGEEQNQSVLQPSERYNFLEYYPPTGSLCFNYVEYIISLDNLSSSCSGLIIFGLPLTNCTFTDSDTTVNFSSGITSIGYFLIILFTCSVIVIRIKKSKIDIKKN